MRTLPLLLLLMTGFAYAAPPAIPLWPTTAPGERGNIGPEHDTTTAKDNLVAGKPVIRLGDVSVPTLTVYKPVQPNGAAVIVFPGGGYRILAMDLEGMEICEWLNSIGVTGILVKYRVPAREGGPRYAAPLQDAQRAVGLVRQHAAEWGIDAKRVGVLGFSAGAHLSAAVSTNYATRSYPKVDAADEQSARPDFTVLLYPGYLAVKEDGDKLPAEIKVDANTPPAFLLQTEDDGVRVENVVTYFTALKAAKVPAEMHVYAKGGHGYGLRLTDLAVTEWPKLVGRWLHSIDVVK